MLFAISADRLAMNRIRASEGWAINELGPGKVMGGI